MGLFSSNKHPCPICGEATPRLLPTKVEGVPICKNCDSKVDLPDGALNAMTLNAFKEYLVCYDANQLLREDFSPNYTYGGGFFGGNALEVNTESRQFRLKGGKGSIAFVFQAQNLASFSIQEDNRPLFTGDVNGLVCHESDINLRLDQMEGSIQYFQERMRAYERVENLDRLHDMVTGDDDRNDSYHARPYFDAKDPIENFRIILTLNHPYWNHFEREDMGPRMDRDDPSTYNYRIKYDEEVNVLYELANALLAVVAPGAPVTQAATPAPAAAQPAAPAAAAPAAAAVDAVAEIQRFKTLLDAGIITEEEFTAKKRQLMGI